MTSLRRAWLRLLAFFRPGRADDDLSREVAAHLQLLEDDFIARGMSREEAHYAARRAFGGVEQMKERQRDTRSFGSIDAWWLDIKLGARMLVKYPGLTIVGGAAMAVAVAIGATAFALIYGSIHPTLPLDEGDRIVGLENWDTASNNQEARILHDFVIWRDELTTVRDLGAFRMLSRNLVTPDGRVTEVSAAEMTATGFRVARVAPLLGRPILDADEQAGATAVAVLGYDLWKAQFASDPDVIGTTVRLGTRAHTIVGVMPEDFAFPVNQDLWTALHADPAAYARRRGPQIIVFGRLAPGAGIDDARAQLGAIGARASAASPETHERLRPRVVRYTEMWFDDAPRSQLHAVQFVLTLLVVLVGVNVAILVYARTATREGEVAVRVALGASRRRVVGQLFLEALVLSLAAAAAGLGLAWLTLREVNEIAREFGALVGGLPFWMQFALSPGTLVYSAGLAFLTAAITGILPALKVTAGRTKPYLTQQSGAASLRLGSVWTALIVLQVAFAVSMLPPAGAMALEAIRVAAAGPGFPAEEYVVANVLMDLDSAPPAGDGSYPPGYEVRYRQRFQELLRRLESAPGVVDVTYTSSQPGSEPSERIVVGAASDSHDVGVMHVGVDFFDVFDVPLLTGVSSIPGIPILQRPAPTLRRTQGRPELRRGASERKRVEGLSSITPSCVRFSMAATRSAGGSATSTRARAGAGSKLWASLRISPHRARSLAGRRLACTIPSRLGASPRDDWPCASRPTCGTGSSRRFEGLPPPSIPPCESAWPRWQTWMTWG